MGEVEGLIRTYMVFSIKKTYCNSNFHVPIHRMLALCCIPILYPDKYAQPATIILNNHGHVTHSEHIT